MRAPNESGRVTSGRRLDYASTASFAALDAYLPSNVAQAIVDTAAIEPFASITSLLAVNGVGASRLQQLLAHARTAGFVGAGCNGIYDDLAVSQDDAAAMVGYVNRVSESELAGVLSFLPFPGTTLDNLLAGRPFASVDPFTFDNHDFLAETTGHLSVLTSIHAVE